MKYRVLIVDDNRLVADTLTMIFRTNGFESEAAYSAADGLVRARAFDPGLLLCDVSMPGGSGLQLAEQMQIELPDCRMLMLTAYSSNTVHIEMQNRSMRHPLKLLRKPCRPELLLREASALLQA